MLKKIINEYEFKEYPKWVKDEDGVDVLVHNADEEKLALGESSEESDDQKVPSAKARKSK